MEIRLLLTEAFVFVDERLEQENRSVETVGTQGTAKCVLDSWFLFPNRFHDSFATTSIKKGKHSN